MRRRSDIRVALSAATLQQRTPFAYQLLIVPLFFYFPFKVYLILLLLQMRRRSDIRLAVTAAALQQRTSF